MRIACLVAIVAVAGCDLTNTTAIRPSATDGRQPTLQQAVYGSGVEGDGLTVMTYNVYQGTELQNALAATSFEQFLVGAAEDCAMMHRTNFLERAQRIASEIDAARPELVGLQEHSMRNHPISRPISSSKNAGRPG